MQEKAVDSTNVFVKFLPSEFSEQDLCALFSPFGYILSAKVMVDPPTGKSLGYGFVKYSTQEEAEKAIKKMSGYKIDNKTLMCKLSDSCAFAIPSPNVYIKPLPYFFTEDMLENVFKQFGTVKTSKIVRDPRNPHDVIGLVRFEDIEGARNACQRQVTLIQDWPPVTVKYAESEAQRAARKACLSPQPPQKRKFSQRHSSGQLMPTYITPDQAVSSYTNPDQYYIAYGTPFEQMGHVYVLPAYQFVVQVPNMPGMASLSPIVPLSPVSPRSPTSLHSMSPPASPRLSPRALNFHSPKISHVSTNPQVSQSSENSENSDSLPTAPSGWYNAYQNVVYPSYVA